MTMKSIAAIALGIPFCATSAAWAEPVPRSPTARWVVDFAEHQCLASQNYGDAKKPLFLALKPSPVGDIIQVAVVKKTASFDSPAQMPVKLQIEDQLPVEFSMAAVSGKNGSPASFWINLPSKAFEPIRTAKRLSVVSGSKLNESFELVQMAALMKAMDECVADLKRHWNIDPDLRSKLRSRAIANLGSLFSKNDYPGVSVQKGQVGSVGMVILVDEQGKPADCMVTQTSNSAALDTQACAIVMQRAKFVAAIGEDGKPAKDSEHARIRWELPAK